MDILSRREEEALLKTTKARAQKECDPVIKEFAECATGRTVSVIWVCKDKYLNIQRCLQKFTTPERMDLVREEYIRQRQAARDAAVFQEAATRVAEGN